MTLLGYMIHDWLCVFKITFHNGGYWGSVEWNDCPNQIWCSLHGNRQRGLAQSLYDWGCIGWFYYCLMWIFRKASLKWCCFGLRTISTFRKYTSKYALSELVRTVLITQGLGYGLYSPSRCWGGPRGLPAVPGSPGISQTLTVRSVPLVPLLYSFSIVKEPGSRM